MIYIRTKTKKKIKFLFNFSNKFMFNFNDDSSNKIYSKMKRKCWQKKLWIKVDLRCDFECRWKYEKNFNRVNDYLNTHNETFERILIFKTFIFKIFILLWQFLCFCLFEKSKYSRLFFSKIFALIIRFDNIFDVFVNFYNFIITSYSIFSFLFNL